MLQQLLYRFTAWVQRFMAGRYGTDKLSLAMLVTALALSVISTFLGTSAAHLVLTLLSYLLMYWALFRVLSRNT